MTRTRKLRRNVIEERYAPVIAALYGGCGCSRARSPHHLRVRRHRRDSSAASPSTNATLGPPDGHVYEIAELSINGALVGLMYTLIALGIVLVFKSSGIANLAQGRHRHAGCVPGLGVFWPCWVRRSGSGSRSSSSPCSSSGRGIERVALRRMIGQPVIMVIMLTLGLEILLRGLAPALFGPVKKRLDIGIDNAPVILGPILIDRAYLISGAVALALVGLSLLFFRSRQGIMLRAVSDDQTASWSVGIPVERAIGISWGLAGVAAAAGRHPVGLHPGCRLDAVAAADQGAGGGDPRRTRQHCWRAGGGRRARHPGECGARSTSSASAFRARAMLSPRS